MLHPSYFGPRMQQYLESKLYSDVEGTCSGQFGFIIAVVSISDIGKGMVLSGNGQAEFITRYRAIVFKPFKGEVVDGVVHNVTRVRESLLVISSFACRSTRVEGGADPSTDGHICRGRPSELLCLATGTQRVPPTFPVKATHLTHAPAPSPCAAFSSSTLTSSLIHRRTHHPTLPKTR
jgi:hypothetical protein